MTDTPEPSGGVPPGPPAPDRLLALGSDTWAQLVHHARAALHDLDESLLDPELRRLRALPTSKLSGGRARRRLAEAIGGRTPLWPALRRRLESSGDLDLLDRPAEPTARAEPASTGTRVGESVDDHAEEVARLKDRAKGFQEERDDALRRLEGAAARAETAERRLAEQEQRLSELERRNEELVRQIEAGEEERRRAVDRERRRGESELTGLREELRDVRRTLHDRDEELRRVRERMRSVEEATATPASAEPQTDAVQDPQFRPGRPSTLPAEVSSGTRPAAELLLHRGRLVLIDGYNVTRTHKPELDLAEQRRWLTTAVAGAAAARGIEPEIVFDGDVTQAGGVAPVRGVRVVFSRGVSADDEIEFRVAALDPDRPVLVVSDDVEVQQRVQAYGADVLGTRPFLWVVS